MPFECKKYHCKCKADCCGVVPIPEKTWKDNQHLLQQKIEHLTELPVKRTALPGVEIRELAFLPITKNFKCPFLKKDLSCAIYDDRPEVCQKFGDETHSLLACPMQDKDGNPK
jgi:Fe-S-cluster containining protein